MELQEAKKIYFRLVQDYNLFKGNRLEYGINVAVNSDYLRLGLLPDLVEFLSEKEKKELFNFADEIKINIEKYWATREEFRIKKSALFKDKFLTSKQKDKRAMELRKEAISLLSVLVEANQALENKQTKVFSKVNDILNKIRKALGGFADDRVLVDNVNLFANDSECTNRNEIQYFADELYTPLPSLEERDFGYYNQIGEGVSYQRHLSEEMKRLGFEAFIPGFTDEKRKKYWRENGYKSETEWFASIHEDYKEREELDYINNQKMKLAYENLKNEGKEEGFFKKFLGGFSNAAN